MASLLNMSGGGLLNKGLPYDAEIEYLQGDHYSWIILPLSIKELNPDKANFSMEVIPTDNNITIFLGANNKGKQMVFQNGYFRADWSGNNATEIGYVRNNNYEVKQENGILYFGTYNISITSSSSSNMKCTLFARAGNNDGTVVETGTIATLKIIYFKVVSLTGDAILDFIPVRIGQVGYMYDKVSGQLFGNAGTGNFILGPDKTN